jgi:tetratricopeptide (TPR) repeat protein
MEKKDKDIPLRSGGLHVVLDIMTEVERVVTEELETHPRFPDLQNRLGLIRFQRQDFEGAKNCFEKALLVNPKYQAANSNLGFSLLELGRIDSAEAVFREALKTERKAHALNELAVLRLRQRMLLEAEGLLREAASIEPGNGLYPHNLAVALFLQGKIREAASSLKDTATLCAPYSQIFAEAILFDEDRLSAEAYREYLNRQEMNPCLSELHDHLGHALAANGFLKEAEVEYCVSLRTMPSLANYYGNLALLYSAQEKEQEALSYYLRAVDAEPDSVKARVALAFEYSASGLATEAMRQFEAAKALKPGYPDLRYNLGLVYLELERTEDAVQEFRAALNSNPNYLFARNSLALVLFENGKLDEALAEYERVFSEGLLSSDILVNIGIIYREKREFGKAVDSFNQAIRLNKEYARAYYQLGQTYQAMGQRKRARRAWKAYLERTHDEAEAADIRKALEEEQFEE